MSIALSEPRHSAIWVHRWARIVTITIFPLIWLGGLVTTQDAGMAVPDWPGTYGYNMFAYPVSAWVYGPFDLMVEHGHRLLGSLAGLFAIMLCVAASLSSIGSFLRGLCYCLLIAIIFQGLLGGARVVFDARTLAMIHGCTGPMVFALAGLTMSMSSSWWKDAKPVVSGGGLKWLSLMLTIATVIQLILGAQLRHVQPWASPTFFTSLVHSHLAMAAVVAVLVFWIVGLICSKRYRLLDKLGNLRWLLPSLLLVQVALGCGTWVANYALPWAESNRILASYVIAAKGYWESWIITGHQATGSLIILASTILMARIWRQVGMALSTSSSQTDANLVAIHSSSPSGEDYADGELTTITP